MDNEARKKRMEMEELSFIKIKSNEMISSKNISIKSRSESSDSIEEEKFV